MKNYYKNLNLNYQIFLNYIIRNKYKQKTAYK